VGADPGPACYDQHGTEATVTDANLVLGRLNPDYFLGGKMKLNSAKAVNAVAVLGRKLGLDCTATAQAVIDVADENMTNAIRLMSVERGLDPRDFTLVSFGGAGPLHMEGIAEKMGMRRIIVPLYPGLCSAFGALIADFKVDKVLSQHFRSTDVRAETLEKIFSKMTAAVLGELREEGFKGTAHIERSISMRYAGQNYEHDVKLKNGRLTARALQDAFESFHKLHEQFYGYSISREVIELIRFNVSVVGPSPLPQIQPVAKGKIPPPLHLRPVYFHGRGYVNCPVYSRAALPGQCKLKGPAILEEPDSTVLLHPGNTLEVSKHGVIAVTL
jgi:N-methylhydantoinase A